MMTAAEMLRRKRLLVESLLEAADPDFGFLAPSAQTREIDAALVRLEQRLRELGIELAVSPKED